DASPVLTSTHSVRPLRTRITNVRPVVLATLLLGTRSDGAVRRTGHLTWQNVPGARRPSALSTSSSTAMVRVATSTDCEIREIVPLNVCPGYAATVNVNDVPLAIPAVYASGTGMTRRSRLLSTIRTMGVAVPGPPVGPTSAPGCTFRSVTTPLKGAVIRRYPSMSPPPPPLAALLGRSAYRRKFDSDRLPSSSAPGPHHCRRPPQASRKPLSTSR